MSGQVGGWALPVFLVLSFNTNEEELVMRAFREEHSVKTAAREKHRDRLRHQLSKELEGERKKKTCVCSRRLHPGSAPSDIVADISLSRTAEGRFEKTTTKTKTKKNPADLAKTRCAKGVFSALVATVRAEGTEA